MPILAILFAIVALAILVTGGDKLLALVPGYPKLIAAVRIIAVVVIALWLLSLVAAFFGIAVPWVPQFAPVHHR